MIFKSIKWRLQLWYGLILVIVLAGLGLTAYRLEWGRQMRRVDEELQRRAGIIANALRPPPPRRPGFAGHPLGSLRPDQPPDEMPVQRRAGPPGEFHLPPRAAGLFGTNTLNNFYFVIFRGDQEFAASANQPNRTVIQSLHRTLISANAPSRFAAGEGKPPRPYTTGDFRDICRPLPSGDFIWVGCSITPELKELNRTALTLAGVGGIILLLGLAGGWGLVRRALRPVDDISAAAAKISAGDLSQRINVAEAESELGRLAAVLNATFSRLEAAFAQQRQFTSDAAHELRTPVTVMLTQTQAALNRERAAAEYRETLAACQRAAQRMRRLIESLLELAQFDAGQTVLNRQHCDFARTVSEGVELVKPLAEERRVQMISKLAPLEITGDAERLAQVVVNLLTNAIQYNRPGGQVRVKLEPADGLAVLTVSDTGQGIAAAERPRVFERFYRADPSRAGAGHAGLGLAICKAIIEAHGGTIVAAPNEDAGTTFTVRLPV